MRLVQTSADGLPRGDNPVALNLSDDFANKIGTGLGFTPQALAGELGGSPLGARGDDRGRDPDQDSSGQQTRDGNFDDFNITGSRLLENLFHSGWIA